MVHGTWNSPYNLEELALHLILPALALQLIGNTEDLLDRTRDHAGSHLRLNKTFNITDHT